MAEDNRKDTEHKATPEEVARKGGLARRQKLTPERRREIASNAAKAKHAASTPPPMPKATHAGPLRIGGVQIASAVLDDGRRVLSQQGFLEGIGRARSAKGGQGAAGQVGGVDETPPFLAANNLKPFIPPDLLTSTTPIPYINIGGARAFGYPATLLPDVCWVFINAQLAGKLTHNQEHIAERCKLLAQGFGKVGIVALVDEATGYQADRDTDDLRRLLEQYLAPAIRPWKETFKSDFFKQVYRLHGWIYRPGDTRTPRYVGKFINEYVYSQLPPDVFEEMKERNPSVKGQRKYRHPQLLTEKAGPGVDHPGVGEEHLKKILETTTILMTGADDKNAFKRAYSRVFPTVGPQRELPGMDVVRRDDADGDGDEGDDQP